MAHPSSHLEQSGAILAFALLFAFSLPPRPSASGELIQISSDPYHNNIPQYGGVCTSGDYAAAAIDGLDNGIWLAAEYIPGGPATSYENWGTRIVEILPK